MKYPLTCLEGNNNLGFVSVPLRPYVGNTLLGTGTGFFFRPVFDRVFLVTNRHIVIAEDEQYFPDRLIMRLHTDAFDIKKHEDFVVSLYSLDGTNKPAWLELDRATDVVALELKMEDLQGFTFHAFTQSDLISPDIVVGVGDPLLVIGYPKGFSDEIHNLPVFRQASVASVYPIPFEGNAYFLIDSELHPGTSGSPVITQPSIWVVKKDEAELFEERQYHLIGIHSAAYGDLKLNVVWFAHILLELCRRASGMEL
jgi:S1-C subfamily serine protease